MDPQCGGDSTHCGRIPKTRHRWTTEEEWEAMRDTITQLYRRDGHELKTIMAIIELEYGFTATVGMFKKRLHSWGLSKVLSVEEKQRLGEVAEELIADGKALPVRDEMNNVIPWNRVRQHYGSDRIPLHCLPPAFRRSKKTVHSTGRERTQPPFTGDTDCSFSNASQPSTGKVMRPTLPLAAPIYPISRPTPLEETLIFHAKEWYSWCATGEYPGSNTALSTLNRCHVRVHSGATARKCKSLTDNLLIQAQVLQDTLRQPSAMLLAALLGIWGITQSQIYNKHGAAFTGFLLASCNDILGPANPLYKIIRVLKEQATLLHDGAPAATDMVDSTMSVVPSVLIDGLESFSRSDNKASSKLRIQPYFVESLDNMLTWNLDAYNPVAGTKMMKKLFYRRVAMLQQFLRFTSRSQDGFVDPTALEALVRLLNQQIQIREAVEAHNNAGLPLKHQASEKTHCASLKTMALACEQVNDFPWLQAVSEVNHTVVPFEETDCFVGMLAFFEKMSIEDKVMTYGQDLVDNFDPQHMWVPQWRSKYFTLFWKTVDGVEVDECWSTHLSRTIEQHFEGTKPAKQTRNSTSCPYTGLMSPAPTCCPRSVI